MPTRNTISAGLSQRSAAVKAAAIAAVNVFVEVQILGKAQSRCPIKTGALAASGTTAPAKLDGDVVAKRSGFNTNYAAAVDQVLTAHHDAPGQARYFSQTIEEQAPNLPAFVAGRIAGAE
jgi:hypothetical protein